MDCLDCLWTESLGILQIRLFGPALLFKGAAILRRLTMIEEDLWSLLTREIARPNLASFEGFANCRCKMMEWRVEVKRFSLQCHCLHLKIFLKDLPGLFGSAPSDCIERPYQIRFRWSPCAWSSIDYNHFQHFLGMECANEISVHNY